MMRSMLRALKLVLWLTLVTGIVYPLAMTGLAQILMHKQAQGSMIFIENKLVGSKLIGQPFSSEQYFWSRPSASNYNPLQSGGSNLGPTSSKLKKILEQRQSHLSEAHDQSATASIPSDLVYASGSGLDPHIDSQSAFFQINRIAKARQLNEEEKLKLIQLIVNMSKASIPFLGPRHINVLELNIALDELKPGNHGR